MLVVGHEEEVVVVTDELGHVVVLVQRCHILSDIHVVVVEDTVELGHEVGEQGIVVDVEFLQVDVDTLEVVFMAGLHQTVDEQLALGLVPHDAADGFRIEVATIVVGEHRQDGHTGLAHLPERLAVDVGLEAVGLWIDEEPLGDDHVELFHALLERPQ